MTFIPPINAGVSSPVAEADVINLVSDLAGKLTATDNLSDLLSATAARTHLGLGTAATMASGAFDTVGAATAAQAAAQAFAANAANLTSGAINIARLPSLASLYLPVAGGTMSGNFAVDGTTSLDGGAIQTDGNGTITALSVIGNCWSIFGGGNVSFDNGAILTDGNGNITLQNCVINFPDGQSFEVVQGYPDFLFYGPVYVDEGLTIAGTTSLDNGYIHTDGNGYITAQDIYLNSAVGSVADAISSLQSDINNNEDVDFAEVEISNFLSVNGTTSLDNGAIHTDGNGTLQAAAYNYNNGAPLTDSNGNLYYNNGNFVADSNGVLYYGNDVGNPLTDTDGNLYCFGTTYLDNGNIYTDGNGNLTVNGYLYCGGLGCGEFGSDGINDSGGNVSILTDFSVVYGTTSFDNGQIYTDGSGNLTVIGSLQAAAFNCNGNITANDIGQEALSVNGTTSLDGGDIYTDGNGTLTAVSFVGDGSQLTGVTAGLGGEMNFDGGEITSDGNGDITTSGNLTFNGTPFLYVYGTTSLDNGQIYTDGNGNITATDIYLYGDGLGSVANTISSLQSDINYNADAISSLQSEIYDNEDVNFTDVEISNYLFVSGITSLDSGGINTDGSGTIEGNWYRLGQTTILDDGSIYTDGNGSLTIQNTVTVGNNGSNGGFLEVNGFSTFSAAATLQSLIAAPQSSEPSSPTMGQIYCDSSGNVHVYNGTAWKQFTVS